MSIGLDLRVADAAREAAASYLRGSAAYSQAWTMLAAQSEEAYGQGVRSLEVRWIVRGQLAAEVAEWFGRFPADTVTLEDVYLLDPRLPGLSVKVRGGRALEVKVYLGSPGLLEVEGRACGRLEFWRKWSFPFESPSQGSHDPAGWRPVSKRRRIGRFSSADGPALARILGVSEQPECAVELTEVQTGGQAWWTLGFEATGSAGLLSSELEAVAALVFDQALPDGVELGLDKSTSYAQWLRRGCP